MLTEKTKVVLATATLSLAMTGAPAFAQEWLDALAHLGGLYRYNQRLAGFHASRADLVELLHLRTGGDTGKITREQLEQIVMLSDALGADKVEFGAQKTPTDQAVELARAIANR